MRLVNERTGEPMRFEFLLYSGAFERIVLPYIRNLARLGIAASARLVDQSQYINRIRSFDFDVIVGGRSEEHTSKLQSLMRISYAVFCLKKKKQTRKIQ